MHNSHDNVEMLKNLLCGQSWQCSVPSTWYVVLVVAELQHSLTVNLTPETPAHPLPLPESM